jgi:hypothetical protein
MIPNSIFLGFTVGRELNSLVALSWIQLLTHQPHPFVGPASGRRGYVSQARNIVVAEFLASDADYLLFLDSDQLPAHQVPAHGDWPGGMLGDYLQTITEGVVAGLYYSRESDFRPERGPHEPVAYMAQDDGYRYLSLEELGPMLQHRGRYPVDGAGTGFMMLRRDVLARMHGIKGGRIFEDPPAPGEQGAKGLSWTEDLYFCHQVRELMGEQVWLDTAIESAHLGDNIWITSQHYLSARGIMAGPVQEPGSRLWTPRQPANRAERRRA